MTSNSAHIQRRWEYALDVRVFISGNLWGAIAQASFQTRVGGFLGGHPVTRAVSKLWVDQGPAIWAMDIKP